MTQSPPSHSLLNSLQYTRIATMEDTDDEALINVINSVESFTVDFYKKVAGKTEGNFVTSALSAHAVLAMAAHGARDNTAAQLRKALHLFDNKSEASGGYRSFINNLNNIQNVILKLSNKIYADNNVTVKDEFSKMTEAYFYSKIETVDFSKPIEIANVINQWCEESTNGKIKDLFSAGDIDYDLKLVLLNTAYFKSNWKQQFSTGFTKLRPFYVNKAICIEVPFMITKNEFFYRAIPEVDAQCLKLPYENENLNLEIILPNEVDGLAYIENNLDKINNNTEYKKYEIFVALPKFKIETSRDLKEHLSEMGMDEMFNEELANFEGISDLPLHISKIQQKAFIEVNEESSEAGVCSRAFLCQYCLETEVPEDFFVNKPFLFKITYKTSTLFIGRVTNSLGYINSFVIMKTALKDKTQSFFNKLIFCK